MPIPGKKRKKIGASELQLASEGGGGAMLARGQASEQCGQHLVDCSMSDKGWRVWGNMKHGQHAAEGRIHEAELQKTRRSVGGSRGSCIGVGWAKGVTACIMNGTAAEVEQNRSDRASWAARGDGIGSLRRSGL